MKNERQVIAMRWDDDGDRWRIHDGMAGSGAGWVIMILLFVLLIGIAVALTVVLLRGTSRPAPGQPSLDSDADRILRRRFAAGEIDEDEFRKRMAALSEYPRGPAG